jgi:hypothetical protein
MQCIEKLILMSLFWVVSNDFDFLWKDSGELALLLGHVELIVLWKKTCFLGTLSFSMSNPINMSAKSRGHFIGYTSLSSNRLICKLTLFFTP